MKDEFVMVPRELLRRARQAAFSELVAAGEADHQGCIVAAKKLVAELDTALSAAAATPPPNPGEGPSPAPLGAEGLREALEAALDADDFGTYEVHIGEVHGNDDAMVVSVEQYERLLKAYEALKAPPPAASGLSEAEREALERNEDPQTKAETFPILTRDAEILCRALRRLTPPSIAGASGEVDVQALWAKGAEAEKCLCGKYDRCPYLPCKSRAAALAVGGKEGEANG